MAEAQKDVPKRYARILALGNAPPTRTKLTAAGRVTLAAPEGARPPNVVGVESSPGETKGISMSLGQLTEPFAFPAAGNLKLNKGEQVGSDVWKQVPSPKSAFSTLMMWRPEGVNHWDKSKAVFIDDSTKSFPAGTIRFINLTDLPVKILLNGKKLELGPGKFLAEKVNVGDNTLEMGYVGKTRNVNLRSDRFKLAKGDRVNAIVWRSDIKEARQAANLFFNIEKAQNYQPKKPKKGRS